MSGCIFTSASMVHEVTAIFVTLALLLALFKTVHIFNPLVVATWGSLIDDMLSA